MLNIIITIIALVALIIASLTDIKTREVPNFLNYSLIFIGITLHLAQSIITNEWIYFFEGLAGFTLMFIIAYIMFYTGQWGGGDSKILMGLGALIGLELTWPLTNIIQHWLSNPPTLILFFIFSLVAGSLYGLIWTIVSALIKWKQVLKEAKKILSQKKIIYIRIIMLIIVVIGLLSLFFIKNTNTLILIFGLITVTVITFYLSIMVKVVEKVCMIKQIAIEKVTEGDWIAKEVKINNKYICGPKDLGIEKEQIQQLLKLKKQKKINKIWVKYGIPFVPSFLAAYLIVLLIGSQLWGLLI